MTRLTPGSSAQTTSHNWTKHRLYVSILAHQKLLRVISLFFKRLSCLGHHNLHVPRTDALLCSYNWNYWNLFIVVPEFFYCQLSLLEFLVRQHLLSSMFGVWTTRDSFTQEDSHFNLLLSEPFENPPNCLSLINFDERHSTSLSTSLPGRKRPMIVTGFGPTELEKCLAMPTSRILERHDFRTILDFLLMKLRTALDQEWLQSVPVLHKV